MKIFSAFVEIKDDRHTPIYLHLEIGGQPSAFAPTLSGAIAGVRGHLTNRRLLLLLASSVTQKRLRTSHCYTYEDDLPESSGFDYHYVLEINPLKPTYIEVYDVSEGGEETQMYRGPIELFVTKELRKRRKPRGRTPTGFKTRDEYEEAYNSRGLPDKAPNRSASANFQKRDAEIERDRRKNPPPVMPDTRGITPYSLEEARVKLRSSRRKKK